jgi:hypothetical protein
MPTDDMWDDDARMIEEVRRHFLEHPDSACVPLLLHIFPDDGSSGFGTYQLIEDVIVLLPREVVLPHLLEALRSKSRGTRYWNAQIAARVPHPSLVPVLAALLEEFDFDLSYAAITALERIGDTEALAALKNHLPHEPNSEIVGLICSVINEIQAAQA